MVEVGDSELIEGAGFVGVGFDGAGFGVLLPPPPPPQPDTTTPLQNTATINRRIRVQISILVIFGGDKLAAGR
jgi:hypothetical protein